MAPYVFWFSIQIELPYRVLLVHIQKNLMRILNIISLYEVIKYLLYYIQPGLLTFIKYPTI